MSEESTVFADTVLSQMDKIVAEGATSLDFSGLVDQEPSTAAKLEEIGKRVNGAAKELKAVREKVSENEDLSEIGREKRIAEQAAKTVATFDAEDARLAELEVKAVDDIADSWKATTPELSAVEQAQVAERRMALKAMSDPLPIINAAANEGDVLTLRAITDSPSWASGFPAATIEKCRQALVQATIGNRLAAQESRLAEIRNARETVKDAKGTALKSAKPEHLTKAGVKTKFRSQMTDAEKSEYLDKHGLDALMSLPL